jgi:hypothetical protein
MGLTIYGANGIDEVWNSDTVAGGVIADVKTYLSTETATLTYPAFPGRSVLIVQLLQRVSSGATGVTADTALGYPRVTVAAATGTRRFAVVVR